MERIHLLLHVGSSLQSSEFFKTWVVPERIEHWIQSKQGRSERHAREAAVWCGKQFL